MSWIRAKCNYVFCEASKNNNFSLVFIVARAYSKPERTAKNIKAERIHIGILCAVIFVWCAEWISQSFHNTVVSCHISHFHSWQFDTDVQSYILQLCVQVLGCELHRAEITRFPPGRLRTYSSNLELQKDALAACMKKNNALNNNKKEAYFSIGWQRVASGFELLLFNTLCHLSSTQKLRDFFFCICIFLFSRGFILDFILADTSKMSSNKLFIE